MSITKKAISVGLSAAMLASLAATVVAPAAALADYSVSGTVSVGAGGTSTTAPTFTFNDASTAAPSSTTGFCSIPGLYAGTATATLTVTLTDSANASTIHFVGTPTLTAPSSLGASVVRSSSGTSFSVTISGCDPNNVEQFSVSGMMIEADSSAATGAIKATLSDNVAGAFTTAIGGATTTATGTLAVAANTGATQILVTLTSACGFSTTGSLSVDSEAANTVTAVSNNGSLYTLTIGTGLSQPEPAGTAVKETGVPSCNSVSPGTVTASVTQTATATNVFPGQNNQAAGTTTVTENAGSAGVIAAATVITFTLPAGVTFSYAPTATPNAYIDLGSGAGVPVTCSLTPPSLQSCSVTVKATTAATTNLGAIALSNIRIDLATTFGAGNVNVTVTTSPAIPVVVSSNTIAYSARVIVGVGAVPTVYIGYNGQAGGLVTLTESAAGFFQSGASGNNQLKICIVDQYGPLESFTFAPYAVVTSGNLMLLNTSTNTGTTSAQGSLDANSYCATWYVYSGSTTASTISIVGATATGPMTVAPGNGPTYSVRSYATPGPVLLNVTTGSNTTTSFSTQVTDAVRAFKTGVVVSAVSQPTIAPGTTGAAGNITIAETGNGYLHAGENITCVVLDSANNENQQVRLSTANSNMLPVVTTNTTSGLIAHLVAVSTSTNSFSLEVDQQAVAPALGTITVSNLNYSVVSGATTGPVTVECSDGTPEFNISAPFYFFGSTFDQFVSNALISNTTAEYASATIAKGVTQTGPFGIATVVTTKGSYVTVKIVTQPALAGAHIGIYIAKKVNGVWTKFSPHTGRIANGSGVVYYYYKAGSVATLAIRGYFSGDATHSAAWSNAVRVAYTK